MGTENNAKSWLQRPEGKFGTAITVGVVGALAITGIYFWGVILPWVITMLTNTLTAAALAVAVAALGVIVFDPRWRNLLVYAYKSGMRALTGLFIEIDPIGIMRNYVESLKEKLAEMDAAIGNLRGQRMKLRQQIEKNEAQRVHSLQEAQQAQKMGSVYRDTFVLKGRQAGRLETSNKTLQQLLDQMNTLDERLNKLRGASAILIEDIQGEVDVRSQERAALLAGYNAFSKAKQIMQGGDDEREMYDMTLSKLADDYGSKMGEIEVFMDMSKSVIDGVDLDKGIYETEALAKLDDWTKNNPDTLFGQPNVRVDAGTHQTRVAASDNTSTGSFADLLNGEDADEPARKKNHI